jgi:Ca2+-binding RTX toxin-like protein
VAYWDRRIAVRASLVNHQVTRLDGEGLVDVIFGIEALTGSELGDVLIGSPGPNTIVGQGGDDEILGRGGSDLLIGDGGDDLLNGGRPGEGDEDDPDLLFGRADFDTCINGNAFGHTADDEPSCEVTDPKP